MFMLFLLHGGRSFLILEAAAPPYPPVQLSPPTKSVVNPEVESVMAVELADQLWNPTPGR